MNVWMWILRALVTNSGQPWLIYTMPKEMYFTKAVRPFLTKAPGMVNSIEKNFPSADGNGFNAHVGKYSNSSHGFGNRLIEFAK